MLSRQSARFVGRAVPERRASLVVAGTSAGGRGPATGETDSLDLDGGAHRSATSVDVSAPVHSALQRRITRPTLALQVPFDPVDRHALNDVAEALPLQMSPQYCRSEISSR